MRFIHRSGKRRAKAACSRKGFTLVELIIVISVSTIMAAMIGSFITRPVQAYVDQARRATLVDAAEGALRRMGRDIRRALPNSIRISSTGPAIELLNTVDGARYRDEPGGTHTTASDIWDPLGDTSFNILGRFQLLDLTYGVPLTANRRLAIYNTDTGVYEDAAANSNPGVITPSTTSITITDDGNEDQLTLSSGFQFELASPEQRLFVVDGPVSYRCDTVNGRLMRYSGYDISAGQPTNPGAPPLSGANAALVADHVSGCAMSYVPGTSERAGLVTVTLTLSDPNGEQIRLLRQVHVDNVP